MGHYKVLVVPCFIMLSVITYIFFSPPEVDEGCSKYSGYSLDNKITKFSKAQGLVWGQEFPNPCLPTAC